MNGAAFGGLVGTVGGFARFLQDQLTPKSILFGEEARQLFYERQRTLAGKPIAMTLGWHVGSRTGEKYFYKEGGGGGFHCMMRLYPTPKIATIVMTNATSFNVSTCLDALDALLDH